MEQNTNQPHGKILFNNGGNLGQFLSKLNNDAELRANEKKDQAKTTKEEKNRSKVSNWYENQKERITNLIMNGKQVRPVKVPVFMDIDDYRRETGQEDSRHSNNKNHDLYNEFINWMKVNGLTVSFIFCHYGQGKVTKAWMEMVVYPQ